MPTDIEVPSHMHITPEPAAEPPSGASEPVEGVNPRKGALDEIYANRARQIEKDNENYAKMSGAAPADEPEPPVAPIAEPAPTDAPPVNPPEAAAAPNAAPQKVRINVEGNQIEVPMDTLITLAQKGMNADQRYQEAANMRRQAEEVMFSNRQTQPQAAPPVAPRAPAASANTDVLNKEDAQRIASKLNFGTEEEHADALREMSQIVAASVQGRAAPGITPDQLVNVATQRALAQLRLEQDQATIASEYGEIFTDYPLSVAAGALAGNLRQEYGRLGVQKPMLEIWREACGSIRNNYVKRSEVQQPQPVPEVKPNLPANSTQAAPATTTERLERKRVAPQPPAAASRIASESQPQAAVSGSQIVAQMRKQRGQPNY